MKRGLVVQISNCFARSRWVAAMLLASLFLVASCSDNDVSEEMTDVLPGYGKLTGSVIGSEPGVLPVVFALNTEKAHCIYNLTHFWHW